jgi:hypothetical protein
MWSVVAVQFVLQPIKNPEAVSASGLHCFGVVPEALRPILPNNNTHDRANGCDPWVYQAGKLNIHRSAGGLLVKAILFIIN